MNDISLRDYFVAEAMQGMIANAGVSNAPYMIARISYEQADAMLAVREERMPVPDIEVEMPKAPAYDADLPVVDSGGWIQWAGGECPVEGDIKVEFRDGDFGSHTKPSRLRWSHTGSPGDIIAYRIVKEASNGVE